MVYSHYDLSVLNIGINSENRSIRLYHFSFHVRKETIA